MGVPNHYWYSGGKILPKVGDLVKFVPFFYSRNCPTHLIIKIFDNGEVQAIGLTGLQIRRTSPSVFILVQGSKEENES